MQGLSETCNLYDTAIETFDGDVCIKGLTKEALKTISIDEKAIQ